MPRLVRIKADGSGEPEVLKSGKFTKGKNTYAYWIRQPVVSPDGSQVAVISDAPNPDDKTLTVQFYGMESDKIARPRAGDERRLGHQDPEWRPDGKYLVYVKNGRDGSRGAPVIMRYNTETGKAGQLTGFGYLYPAYSRDGKYLAATRTSAFGTDIVILDAGTGQELLRVTDDGASWGPTWSPAGDGIAYLHLDGQTVDLRLAKLDGDAPNWTVSDTIELTEVSDLEPASRPDWFIPADQLPALPTPAPAASPSAAAQRGPVTTTYLERLAARSAATGTVLCLGLDPDPAGLPPGVRAATSAGVEAFAGLVLEAALPARRGGQAQPRLLRGVRLGRASPPSSGCARASRPTCRSSPTASAATSSRPPAARPWPCSMPSAWTP